ncbi:MAG: sigma-70 family RNA polymerase sigma factor [Acidobacteriia bacterium]|nr:sigma-70 family RNA polymerase sigma factor [Terriglobia bacterium]
MPEEPEVDWKNVVELIQRGDPAGEETLYRTLLSGARQFLRRRLGTQDVDDRVHDVFLIVAGTIRRGELQHPERLMAFVRTVLYRQLNLEIGEVIRRRDRSEDLDETAHLTAAEPTPEQRAITGEKVTLMKEVLRKMSDRDFEVLSRFYLREQPPKQICAEMELTQVQFQLLKSRAKARLADRMRRKLAPNPSSQQR